MEMGYLRTICRPNALFTSFICRRYCFRVVVDSVFRVSTSFRCPSYIHNSYLSSSCFLPYFGRKQRMNHRTYIVRATDWAEEKSPYEILELDRGAEGEQIKFQYRRLAKFYHPDVYGGKGNLEDGETAEARFIKIQAAYELLIDVEKRKQYDMENQVNPMKASQAWMEWLMKKRKAFDQRGDLAIAAWAEQQQREMNLRARRLTRSKVDPAEEKKILAREKKASIENFNTTLRRHTLVLKKRDIMRKKAEEEREREIQRLLAAEGFELEMEDE